MGSMWDRTRPGWSVVHDCPRLFGVGLGLRLGKSYQSHQGASDEDRSRLDVACVMILAWGSMSGSEDVALNQRIEQLIDKCLEISSRVCNYCLVPMRKRSFFSLMETSEIE